MINNSPTRYLVFYPSYDRDSEENCENYSTYSCKLDNIPGMTKSYSMAVSAADQNNGTIFEEVNGEFREVKKKHFKQ